jgi:signal peptidase I
MTEHPETVSETSPDNLVPSEVSVIPFPPPKSRIRDYFEQALVTVVMALFLMTFISQAVQVPTGSMQNNIHIGDHLFVNKFVFGEPTPILRWILPQREIRRGDIIVFKYPLDAKTSYVKRVVGLPGDKVHVHGERLYINDQELPEIRVKVRLMGNDYSSHPELDVEPPPEGARYRVYYDDREHDFETGEYGVNEPITVPEGNYFALGDNRDNSQDSRYWGFVPRSNIIGRALYVYWSSNPRDPQYQGPQNPVMRFFLNTDWKRTGTAIK